jgi:hypothetical protein
MIRRLLVLFAVLAATAAFATPASADGAFTETQNFHGTFPPFQVGPLCGAPGGTVFATGNAVFHITVNGAGDTWITTTQEATFTLIPTTGTVTYSGHVAVWFGVSINNQNIVTDHVINVQATGSDGSTLTVNFVDHLSVSASGQVNMFMDCH